MVRTRLMAIKVIEAPLDHRVVKRTPCGNCGVTLEYTPADTYTRQVRDYTGDSDNCRYIDCPKCRHAVQVGVS